MDTYEKKYEEAQKWIESIYSELSHEQQMEAEAFFPELKESEDVDKKIREEIIATIHLYYGKPLEDEAKEMIAWLEKQEGCEYIKKDWLEHIKQSWYKEGFIDGKYSNKTPKEWTINDTTTLNELIDFLENGTAKLQHDLTKYANWLKIQFTPIEKQGEQKPAWSEEDESRMDNLCHFLEEYGNQYYGHLTLQGTISWLKSLKDRVQPKQEWNKWDMEMLNAAISFVEHSSFTTIGKGKNNTVAWLKSLKSRVIPQSRQEWSKEDETKMHAALAFIKSEFPKEGNEEFMEDTIEWLKSLRPQKQWKPSKGQLECLGYAIDKAEKDYSPLANNRIYLTLKALKKELEKLTE